jgi:CDP-paratose 2-epimerase
VTGRAALGLVEWLPPGAQTSLERVLAALAALRVRHLRFGGPWTLWADPVQGAWYDALIPRLAAQVQLLPCCWYVPGSQAGTGYATYLEALVARHGAHFEHVELWDEAVAGPLPGDAGAQAHCAALGAAAYSLRRLGKKTVVSGLHSAAGALREPLAHGLGVMADVIGLRAAPGSAARPWAWHVEAAHTALREFRCEAEIWISAGGHGAGPTAELDQAGALADLAEAPVARAYWATVCDPPTAAGEAGSGLLRADGSPRPAWRLWAKDPGLKLVGEVTRWSRRAHGRRGPRPGTQRPALITGGAGFLGTNLAQRLASKGRPVRIADNLARPGVEENLRYLMERHPRAIEFVPLDVRDRAAVAAAVEGAGTVFHLAAQVAVTTSLAAPRADFEVNLGGTLNLLEALRERGCGALVFASTNKVYGDLGDVSLTVQDGRYLPHDVGLRRHGLAEDRALDFHSPYGCSKGGADQYVLDYGRCFGLRTLVLRMSCIYGPHQHGTEDQGWVAHFARAALAGTPICLYGDGQQVRDVLFVGDAVDAYLAAERALAEHSGLAFNLGGGPEFSVSLREVVARLGALLGRDVAIRSGPWRVGDQRWYVSDTRRFQATTGWRAQVAPAEGIARLAHFLETGTDSAQQVVANVPVERTAGARA